MFDRNEENYDLTSSKMFQHMWMTKDLWKILYITEKLIGHCFRHVIKTGFAERHPYRNKYQCGEKVLTAASGLFKAETGQIKKSNSDLMWHPALFQHPERWSSFLEAALSSSAPGGRGEQQDRATVSQHVNQGDAIPQEGTGSLTGHGSVSSVLPSATTQRGHWCCLPFCKGQVWMEVPLVRCVAEGKKGLALTREFQNTTAIDFTGKKNGNASSLKLLPLFCWPAVELSEKIKSFCYHFLPQNEKVAQSASNVAASQQQVASSVLIYYLWEEAEK